jgi:hypothetical protein
VKLQNILWVPVMTIGLGVALLSGAVTAQQRAGSAQANTDRSRPEVTEAVLAGGMQDDGSISTAAGESLVPVALFTPGATPQEEGSRQALLGALMAAILMGGTGLIVVYVVAATRRRERYLQPTLQASAYAPDSGVAAR